VLIEPLVAQESCSFLKKRTKKLLSVSGGAGASRVNAVLQAISKSFLLLFFKKKNPFSA
jgi:hypothetical protein